MWQYGGCPFRARPAHAPFCVRGTPWDQIVVRLKYAKAIGVVDRPPQDVAKKFQLVSSYFTLEGFDLRFDSNRRVGGAAIDT